MLDHPPASPSRNSRRLLALLCLSALVLSASQAGAFPRIQLGPAPGFLLVQGAPPDSERGAQEDPQAPIADLDEVLEATRAKFEELFDATAAAVAEQRKELQVLKQENERLAAELQQADARSTELENSNELADARIAELSQAVDEAVREAARLDEALAGQIRRNEQLEGRLASADAAHKAAVAEVEETREQSRAELAELREDLETTRQQLATANRERERGVARMSAVEEVLERSGAEAERLKTELAAVKEQLGQATSAAVEAERARQAASSEAARLRDELTAANTDIERFKTANAELEKETASWRESSKSAIETALQNLIMMEQKIEELNAALGVAQPQKRVPTRGPEAKPDAAEDDRSAEAQASSAIVQPPAPEPEADRSGLTSFHANVEDLNDRALAAAGVDLFSGAESVGDHVVHVSTTAAWDLIPPAGQLSYLNSLLDYWVAAQGGKGPAVVRIVDRDGRVLIEKSWP